MSVASSRFTNVSSILRSTEIKSELIKQNNAVVFQLPKDIDNIFFKNTNQFKDLGKLICALQEGNIKVRIRKTQAIYVRLIFIIS